MLISNTYLLKDLAAYSSIKANVSGPLAAFGLGRGNIDPFGKMTLALYLDVCDAMLETSRGLGVGLITGFSTSLKDHGMIGYAMIASGSLREAVRLWLRYYDLLCWPFENAFSQTAREARLAIVEPKRRMIDGQLRIFGIEMWMANWAAAFRDFFGAEPGLFHEVRLAYPDPGYRPLYEEVLGCPVHFDCEASEIRFSKSLLDRPALGANAPIAQFCEHQCQALVAELNAEGSLAERVRTILLSEAGHLPRMDELSDRLHMSERSLRRKLEEEGSTYKEILGKVRMRMAGEYLVNAPHMKTQEISDLLGYSEVAAFNRAFKRWYGVPPTSYRQAHSTA